MLVIINKKEKKQFEYLFHTKDRFILCIIITSIRKINDIALDKISKILKLHSVLNLIGIDIEEKDYLIILIMKVKMSKNNLYYCSIYIFICVLSNLSKKYS